MTEKCTDHISACRALIVNKSRTKLSNLLNPFDLIHPIVVRKFLLQKEQNKYIMRLNEEQTEGAVMIIRDVLALGSLITFMSMLSVWTQILA